MLLLHRLTSFFLVFAVALSLSVLFLFPSFAFLILGILLLVVALLYARLLVWEYRTGAFWVFLGIPILFLFSGFLLILFLESDYAKWVVISVLLFFPFLFTEYVFLYRHIPTTYRPYAIEYLALVLNLLTFFALMSVGYGLRLFLQVHLFLLIISCFLLVLFLLFSIYWVSKIDWLRARPYVIGGTILVTECFTASLFLPTSLFTSAAMMCVLLYLYIGMTRAELLKKLTVSIARRYLLAASLFLLLLIVTTPWV